MATWTRKNYFSPAAGIEDHMSDKRHAGSLSYQKQPLLNISTGQQDRPSNSQLIKTILLLAAVSANIPHKNTHET